MEPISHLKTELQLDSWKLGDGTHFSSQNGTAAQQLKAMEMEPISHLKRELQLNSWKLWRWKPFLISRGNCSSTAESYGDVTHSSSQEENATTTSHFKYMAHKNKKKKCINNKREWKKRLFWKKRNPLLQCSIQTPMQTQMKARMVKWVLESLMGSWVPLLLAHSLSAKKSQQRWGELDDGT